MWQNKPFQIEVHKGKTLYFCACGNSKNGPYCDGSHKGTEFKPYAITFEEDKTIWACGCQQSKNRPFCDGSHKNLKEE